MTAFAIVVSVWLSFGAVCGWWAGRSWKARWGQDSTPPFGILGGALFGLAAIGFVIAEIEINRERDL